MDQKQNIIYKDYIDDDPLLVLCPIETAFQSKVSDNSSEKKILQIDQINYKIDDSAMNYSDN